MIRHQCTHVYMTKSGLVFCCRPDGHEGDHRGSRKQWGQDGKPVPITLKDDGT